MSILYSEEILNKLKKEDLLEITAKNNIAVFEGVAKSVIIELILNKGCVMSSEEPAESTAESTAENGEAPVFVDNPNAEKFTKAEILKSHWYSHKRDFLYGVLEDNKAYSYAAIERLIKTAK